MLGQAGVGAAYPGVDGGIAAGRRGAEQGHAVRLSAAEHHRLAQQRAGQQFGFDPLGADVAAEGGDDQVVAPAVHVHEAGVVQMAQVTGAHHRCRAAGRRPQIAQKAAAADFQFAVARAQPQMRQRPPGTARPVGARRVQTDHRGALGQAVALVHRQPAATGGDDLRRRHAGATDRHEPQRPRRTPAARHGGQQCLQQGRHQDQAVRLMPVDGRGEPPQVQPAAAGQADFRQRRQLHAAVRQQRRIDAADVLQQRGQRQQAQMAHAGQGDHPCQRIGNPLRMLGRQAHALGGAGGAGAEGDLGGAGRHRRGGCRQAPEGQSGQFSGGRLLGLQGAARPARPGRGECVATGCLQGVAALLWREERRQRHQRYAGQLAGEVDHHPGHPVVRPQCQAAHAAAAQRLGGVLHRGDQGAGVELPS